VDLLLEISKVIQIKIDENSENFIAEESEDLEKIIELLEEIIIHINENGNYEFATNIFSELFYKILLRIFPKLIEENEKIKK